MRLPFALPAPARVDTRARGGDWWDMAFIINGERIEDEILEEEFESIKSHFQSRGEVVCCDRDDEFWGYARDNIINRALLAQEAAARFGTPTEAEVDAKLARLMEEHGGEKEFWDNTGFNPGDLPRIRERLASSIGIDRVLEAEIGPDPDPSGEELQAHYQQTISRYLTEEEVRVSQLFKEPKSHEDARRCYRELRETRELLLDGADFHETAAERGDKPAEEIDLGYLKMGETMPEIEAIVFSLREGEVSPIVATHFGFHLFQVTGRKPPEPVPYEQVAEQVRQQFLTETRESAIAALIGRLKEAAAIQEA